MKRAVPQRADSIGDVKDDAGDSDGDDDGAAALSKAVHPMFKKEGQVSKPPKLGGRQSTGST